MMRNGFKEQLVEHVPALRRYAQRLTMNRTDSEDLVQNTLLRALCRRHLWDPEGGSLSQWLNTLCRHQFIDDFRRAKRSPFAPLDDVVVRSAAGIAENDVVEIREVEDRLRTMHPHHRQLLLLAAEGTTYPEIATVMRLPRGTVASRLSRARELLAAATDRYAKDAR
jgi:RNA polymerase sigma-70 factor (ECF subfamily)